LGNGKLAARDGYELPEAVGFIFVREGRVTRLPLAQKFVD
jgi:hypothetical protein